MSDDDKEIDDRPISGKRESFTSVMYNIALDRMAERNKQLEEQLHSARAALAVELDRDEIVELRAENERLAKQFADAKNEIERLYTETNELQDTLNKMYTQLSLAESVAKHQTENVSKLFAVIKVYADPVNWNAEASDPVWYGPGDGPYVAKQVLMGVKI